jgi:hypothetical protein
MPALGGIDTSRTGSTQATGHRAGAHPRLRRPGTPATGSGRASAGRGRGQAGRVGQAAQRRKTRSITWSSSSTLASPPPPGSAQPPRPPGRAAPGCREPGRRRGRPRAPPGQGLGGGGEGPRNNRSGGPRDRAGGGVAEAQPTGGRGRPGAPWSAAPAASTSASSLEPVAFQAVGQPPQQLDSLGSDRRGGAGGGLGWPAHSGRWSGRPGRRATGWFG